MLVITNGWCLEAALWLGEAACVVDALLEEYLFGEEDAVEDEDAFVTEEYAYGEEDDVDAEYEE